MSRVRQRRLGRTRRPLERFPRSPRRALALMLALMRRPLPVPPPVLRRGPFRAGTFTSSARGERLTSQLGVWLGVAFAICFATGLVSHGVQHPASWFVWPSRPVSLYRVTQGLHVATGLASVALLAAKLWSVYPKLFRWPPVRDLVDVAARAGLAVLVATALFQLVTGVLNIARWYAPMPFFFPSAHYWTAWMAVGAMLIHLAAKLPVIVRGLRSRPPLTMPQAQAAPLDTATRDAGGTGGMTRRGVLLTAAGAATTVTIATAGQSVGQLSRVSPLAPRSPDLGPQGLPVNASAIGAGVVAAATDPGYRLVLRGPTVRRLLSIDELAALQQTTVDLPIACVEGWSAEARWTGVAIRDLAVLVGVRGPAEVRVESLQRGGLYRASVLPPPHVADPATLLALRLHGQRLALDHGYPCRIVAPNRPGVLQTKWVAELTVVPR